MARFRGHRAANDSDLFWACRGGAGGNFGINTVFSFDLVEAPKTDVTSTDSNSAAPMTPPPCSPRSIR